MQPYSPLVLTEIDGGIGIVTLNRPLQHNLMDASLAESLIAAIDGMVDQHGVRVIVLSALGDSFCIGADPLELECSGLMNVEPAPFYKKIVEFEGNCDRLQHYEVRYPALAVNMGIYTPAGKGGPDMVADADTYRICYSLDPDRRPTGFTADAGSRQSLFTLKRQK